MDLPLAQVSQLDSTFFVTLAAVAARAVLPLWSRDFPNLRGPEMAIDAADKWLRAPAATLADQAEELANRAIGEVMRLWSTGRSLRGAAELPVGARSP